MATATLDSPLDLDPRTATTLVIVSAVVDFISRTVQIECDLVSGGVVLERRRITADGSAVQTWISNQESALYTRLMAKLGVTGTVG